MRRSVRQLLVVRPFVRKSDDRNRRKLIADRRGGRKSVDSTKLPGGRSSSLLRFTFTIPNAITASRILLTPIFLWLLLSDNGVLVQFSAGVFLLAAISDWYDGWYARRHKITSPFGTFFDPLADKIFIGAAFFAFAALDVVELWMVAIIVARDVITTVIRIIADRRGRPVVTSRLAKWKTALQLVFLWYVVGVWTMLNIEWVRERLGNDLVEGLLSYSIVDPAMIILVLLSIVTATLYIVENRHVLGIRTEENISG